MDQRSAIVKANEDGMEKGRDEMAKEIARRLLTQMSDPRIAEITGLSPDQVAALRAEPEMK